MANRTSNRAARLLLFVPIASYRADVFRISNRRWQVYGLNCPFAWQFAKPSRQQKRAHIRHLRELHKALDEMGNKVAV